MVCENTDEKAEKMAEFVNSFYFDITRKIIAFYFGWTTQRSSFISQYK
jgi:hypothetical protein